MVKYNNNVVDYNNNNYTNNVVNYTNNNHVVNYNYNNNMVKYNNNVVNYVNNNVNVPILYYEQLPQLFNSDNFTIFPLDDMEWLFKG